MEGGLLPNKLEVYLPPPWKLVEASMEVDGSGCKPGSSFKLCVHGSRWK